MATPIHPFVRRLWLRTRLQRLTASTTFAAFTVLGISGCGGGSSSIAPVPSPAPTASAPAPAASAPAPVASAPAPVASSPAPAASAPAPAASAPAPTPVNLALEKIGGFTHEGGEASSEISAFDAASKRLFVVNGSRGTVDVLDLSNPGTPTFISTIAASAFGAGLGAVNSVASRDGVVALAIEANPKQNPGVVGFLRASDARVVGTVSVGALPDMLTFSPNGRMLLVANEGEPNSYGQADSVDPEGSVSLIEVAGLSPTATTLSLTVTTADFRGFNAQADALRSAGVRIFGPGASVAQDLEPEYITVSADSATAWVTLQENNAVAVIDLANKRVSSVKSLGLKDHSRPGNGLDLSNEDGTPNSNAGTPTIKISSQPIRGMYQPDAIASYRVGSTTYLITANEGDVREYRGITASGAEEIRVRDFCTNGFDSTVFGTDTASLSLDANLGRLLVTSLPGNGRTGKNAAGQCNELLSFGARSFSIWTADANLLWDSGDQFEQRTAALSTTTSPTFAFNASNSNNTLDSRSPSKGPEPEGVTVATFGAKTFAFVALERVGGVMVYDVSNPLAPQFITYLNTRTGTTGDRGPEGLTFIAAADSPNGKPLLIVNHETSGTTAVYQINLSF